MNTQGHDGENRVLVLDFGSQYTQFILRRIRELKVYCEVQPFEHSLDDIPKFGPGALILSGGLGR